MGQELQYLRAHQYHLLHPNEKVAATHKTNNNHGSATLEGKKHFIILQLCRNKYGRQTQH
jgi:hypothetical protein